MPFLETDSWRLLAASAEILLLLCFSAAIGWLIARILLKSRIRTLKELIADRKVELASCRSVVTETSHRVMPEVSTISSVIEPALSTTRDDLKLIEGIGPKIEELLNKEGIFSFAVLSDTSPIRLSSILRKAGPRYQIQDPSSWPAQAALAKNGKWDELATFKLGLISGRSQ